MAALSPKVTRQGRDRKVVIPYRPNSYPKWVRKGLKHSNLTYASAKLILVATDGFRQGKP